MSAPHDQEGEVAARSSCTFHARQLYPPLPPSRARLAILCSPPVLSRLAVLLPLLSFLSAWSAAWLAGRWGGDRGLARLRAERSGTASLPALPLPCSNQPSLHLFPAPRREAAVASRLPSYGTCRVLAEARPWSTPSPVRPVRALTREALLHSGSSGPQQIQAVGPVPPGAPREDRGKRGARRGERESKNELVVHVGNAVLCCSTA